MKKKANTELNKLRDHAKMLGIKSYWNKGEDRLRMEIEALAPKRQTKIPLKCNNSDLKYFDRIGFKEHWLAKYIEEDGIEEFQYIHKFRAFRCYINGMHVDWIDINRVSLDHGQRELCEILLPHQPVASHRKVIGVTQ
jgi:hypothetical protein